MAYELGSIFYSTLTGNPVMLINKSLNLPGKAVQDTYGLLDLENFDMYLSCTKTAVAMEKFLDDAIDAGNMIMEGDR